MTEAEPTPPQSLTVAQWRRAGNGEAATPHCPDCGAALGIRLGIWRDNCRDAWVCECGERESVPVPERCADAAPLGTHIPGSPHRGR